MTTQTLLSVLLVEDDDAYARLLDRELRSSPSAVLRSRARTLAEASATLRASEFDVVLLDLGLPDSSGLDTLRDLRRAAPDQAVVVLTSRDDDALAIAALQSGAEDYLVKSDTDGQLLARALRYACERGGLRRALVEREAQLRQAQKMEAVGRLAGGVAHDFNNVLTAIFGYADLLLDQFAPDDPRRADVQEIRRSAERAAALTRQLLAFSRKQVLQPRVLNLNEVIENLRRLLDRLVGEDVELVVVSAADLWPVQADPGQFEQVLMNLCANARDAMPDGGRLEIETSNQMVGGPALQQRPGLQAGPYVVLTVSDSGHGMPESVREHIFEPFFTTKGQGQGTGLGLPMVYGIVKQSGGGTYVESAEGKGTRVLVYLPRAAAPRPGTSEFSG